MFGRVTGCIWGVFLQMEWKYAFFFDYRVVAGVSEGYRGLCVLYRLGGGGV